METITSLITQQLAFWYIQWELNNATPNIYKGSNGSSGTGSFYSYWSTRNYERALAPK